MALTIRFTSKSKNTAAQTDLHVKPFFVHRGETNPTLRVLKNVHGFEPLLGQTCLIRPLGEKATLFCGLGDATQLSMENLRTLGAKLYYEMSPFENIEADCDWLETAEALQALCEGLLLSDITPKTYQTGKKKDPTKKDQTLFIKITQKDLSKNAPSILQQTELIAESVKLAQVYSNEPANIGTATYYAQHIKKLAKTYGIKCTLIEKSEQIRQKMGLFLGVNEGSKEPGVLVVLEYAPKKYKKTVGLVGKGVTFDSGGISIKPSLRMEEMKHDMTGAATIVAAAFGAARLKSPHRIVAVAAFTDNLPSGSAQVPSSVKTSRSGKTVEIINTDAEGRLILGDALDLIQDLKVDEIIDLATLTGAVGVALGKYCAAILGNNQRLIEALKEVGQKTHERLWQLPLFDEYFEDLKSDVADMKNANNDSYAGTIKAASFLKQFIKNGLPWAHLDIATTAYNITHLPYLPKRGASGQFVRLLIRYLTQP
jgi:leucyl aminopeptidase